MDNENILNEEKYQQSKKRLIIIAVVVLLIGLAAGSSLIFIGKMKVDAYNKKVNNVADKVTTKDETVDLSELKKELSDLRKELTKEFTENGFSDKYNDINEQIEEIQSTIEKNEVLDFIDDFGVKEIATKVTKNAGRVIYAPYFMGGGFIIFSTSMVAIFLFIAAKRRDINAFTTQQDLPIEKAKAKEMAKGITEGVKEGLEDKE